MQQAHGGASQWLTTENDFKLSSATLDEIVEDADKKLFTILILFTVNYMF